MDEEKRTGEPMWYVIHTYSGYENKVKANIEKTIENRPELKDQILEVRVPLQKVTEVKNGKKTPVDRKMFPGYVLLHMVMNDDTWYVVRNTRGVTGFVGPGSKPVPLTAAEMYFLGETATDIEIDFEEGDMVNVIAGAWKDTTATVKSINRAKQTVAIIVDVFGRETVVDEIGFAEIRKA
ncbi:MAG: transcription termination/antitermination protein NusG [Lachnospiraceae bacterium]|nr:transcription termination/antitermination protein NusG [Lachnospiraceae bacterium]